MRIHSDSCKNCQLYGPRPQTEKWRQEEKERKKREKERDKEKKATLRRMPGVKRRERERGKTQPVRFEEVQQPEKGQGQGQRQGEGQDKDSSGAAEDGSSAKRLRHTRSHSTPNMPALEEALSSAKSNNDGGEDEKVKALKSAKLSRLASLLAEKCHNQALSR